MYNQYFKEYSHYLNRDMEFKVFGHGGRPMLVFPCQDGKFHEFEDRHMLDTIQDLLEDGKIQLFCIGVVDEESWSLLGQDYGQRIEMHERWMNYICEEAIPRFHEIRQMTSPDNHYEKFLTTGFSLGAFHALNTILRRPDLFAGCVALSGLYHASYFFPNYNDERIYFNSPVDFLRNMSYDDGKAAAYRDLEIILCVGQGNWEEEGIKDQRILVDIFNRLDIPAWVDFWGYDVDHDWPWWEKEFPYFVRKLV